MDYRFRGFLLDMDRQGTSGIIIEDDAAGEGAQSGWGNEFFDITVINAQDDCVQLLPAEQGR